jgi:hypothetical protein
MFSADQTSYCVAKVANTSEDTTLNAIWTAVDVEVGDSNLLIIEFELNPEGENEFTFNLQHDQLWPSGSYKVENFMDGKLEKNWNLRFNNHFLSFIYALIQPSHFN